MTMNTFTHCCQGRKMLTAGLWWASFSVPHACMSIVVELSTSLVEKEAEGRGVREEEI